MQLKELQGIAGPVHIKPDAVVGILESGESCEILLDGREEPIWVGQPFSVVKGILFPPRRLTV
jgi:hypothetical protein